MKLVVLNYPGTVGKTTLTVNLLKIRMPDADIIAVESINETAEDLGVAVRQITGERFREVFTRLMKTDQLIVDVGASNIEDFLEGMAKYEGSHEEVDFFVIPVTSGTKEQKETLAMFKALTGLGVHPDKIKIVFNRVDRDVEAEFEILFKYSTIDSQFKLNPRAAVEENELFDLLGVHQTTLQAVLTDTADYHTLMHKAGIDSDLKLRDKYANAAADRRLAVRVNRNLDQAFEALFGVVE